LLIVVHLAFYNVFGWTTFEGTSLVLARIVIFLVLFATLFTSSMIFNQVYGLITGLGTIDRMKLKDEIFPLEDSIPFSHVFGDQWYLYWAPVEPVFYNSESVLHYRVGSEPFNPTKV